MPLVGENIVSLIFAFTNREKDLYLYKRFGRGNSVEVGRRSNLSLTGRKTLTYLTELIGLN